MKAPLMMRKVLALCLGLLVVFSSCRKDDTPSSRYQSVSFEDLMTYFRNGEVLASVSKIEDQYHRVSFQSGRSFVFNDAEFGFASANMVWPSVVTDANGTWMLNGKSRGIKATETAGCVVASYFDKDGAWFRLDNGEFIFFNYSNTREIGAAKIEKINNPALAMSVSAAVDGNMVSVRSEEVAPITTTVKPTFAVRGTGLKINGIRFINGQTSISLKGATVSYTGFDGETKTLKFASDIEPQVPKIHITTNGGLPITSKHDYIFADFRVEDPFAFYGESAAVTVTGQIRGRGNTTWDMPKKPYRIKFDEKVALMGMPKSRHWALLANFSDKTLMRNSTCMRISEELGVLVWTPRHRHAEVYLNGEYLGLYTVIETVRPAKDRVPLEISGVDPGTDLTGGYLIEIDDKWSNAGMFQTAHGVPIGFRDPDAPTGDQINYIKNYIQKVEDAVYSNHDPNYYSIYSPHIDIPSFAANYIIQELVKNIDGNFRLSNFLAKYQGNDVLYMTNIWDFDLAIGNCDYFNSMYGATNTYEGFFVWGHSHWYSRLFTSPEFKKAVKDMWNSRMYPKIDKIIADVRNDVKEMRPAIDRNFDRWKILGVYHWPNLYVDSNYDNNLNYMLNYLKQRSEWLNTEINKW